jgi:hypothetical protein
MQDPLPGGDSGVPQQVPEIRRHGPILAIFLSFFSAELYRDIASRWRGIGLRYLLLLIFLTSIPEAFNAQRAYDEFLKRDAPVLLAGFPTLTIENGQVRCEDASTFVAWRF